MGGVLVELAVSAFTDAFTVLIGIAALVVLLRIQLNIAWLIAGGAAIGGLHALLA